MATRPNVSNSRPELGRPSDPYARLEGGGGVMRGGARTEWRYSPRVDHVSAAPDPWWQPSYSKAAAFFAGFFGSASPTFDPVTVWEPREPRYIDASEAGWGIEIAPEDRPLLPGYLPAPADGIRPDAPATWYNPPVEHSTWRDIRGLVAPGAHDLLGELAPRPVRVPDIFEELRSPKQLRYAFDRSRLLVWDIELRPAARQSVRVAASPRWVRPGRKEFKPKKAGGASYRTALAMINLTYGRASEAVDFLDVLAQNVWVKDAFGRIYQPYHVKHDIAFVLRGVVAGRYYLDLVGAAHDLRNEALMDRFYAATDIGSYLRSQSPVWHPIVGPDGGAVLSSSPRAWKDQQRVWASWLQGRLSEPQRVRAARVRASLSGS